MAKASVDKGSNHNQTTTRDHTGQGCSLQNYGKPHMKKLLSKSLMWQLANRSTKVRLLSSSFPGLPLGARSLIGGRGLGHKEP